MAGEDAFESASRRLDEGLKDAVAAIRDDPDLQRGFEKASRLRDQLAVAVGYMAKLRGERAAAIMTAEELSLSGLAERIGVSKERASQFVRGAKEGEDGGV